MGQIVAVTRAPNREKASGRIKKASGHVKEASGPDNKKALGQDEDSDLVQRRASIKTVESASLEGAPSSVNQSRETEPRMRDPEKVLDQDEGSDLLQI